MAAVGAFEHDSNRKSLVKPHPIQSLFDIWQAADGPPFRMGMAAVVTI